MWSDGLPDFDPNVMTTFDNIDRYGMYDDADEFDAFLQRNGLQPGIGVQSEDNGKWKAVEDFDDDHGDDNCNDDDEARAGPSRISRPQAVPSSQSLRPPTPSAANREHSSLDLLARVAVMSGTSSSSARATDDTPTRGPMLNGAASRAAVGGTSSLWPNTNGTVAPSGVAGPSKINGTSSRSVLDATGTRTANASEAARLPTPGHGGFSSSPTGINKEVPPSAVRQRARSNIGTKVNGTAVYDAPIESPTLPAAPGGAEAATQRTAIGGSSSSSSADGSVRRLTASAPTYTNGISNTNGLGNYSAAVFTPARPTHSATLGPPPTVQTPSMPPPLPAPLGRSVTAPTFATPDNVPTPTQTPTTVGGARRDPPDTPSALNSVAMVELQKRTDFQKISKVHDDHAVFLKKTAAELNGVPARGKPRGRGGRAAISRKPTTPLGAKVLKGLRFVIANRKPATKYSSYFKGITESGGDVVLEPDTAITHVIYDPGKNPSAATLARELGLSSLSDLPKGTYCVKYDWVQQCKLHMERVPEEPWLSFQPTTLTRGTTSHGPQGQRMQDITHQLQVNNGPGWRKRAHSPSDSEDDSSLSQQRAKRGPPPASPSDPPTPAAKRLRTDVEQTATSHAVASGPRWPLLPAHQRDGLDDVITGLLDGTMQELSDYGSDRSDDEVNATVPSDEDGNPDPKGNRFKCGQKHDGTSTDSPNEWLAQEFDKLFNIYDGDPAKNSFSIQGYQKTAGILRRTSYAITSGKQARKLKGIGQNMADRIDEFITGVKGRAYYENTESARSIALFKKIYGVGRSGASTLYQKGARTIEDLRTKDYGLTAKQKIGVELYEDLCSRIPREECRQLFETIRNTALSIDPKLSIEIMGSYRRGEENSGDIDILFTRNPSDGITHVDVLRKLLKSLHRQGFITHDLSEPSDLLGLEAKWMGVGRLTPESKHRRIDILCIPYEQWGAALLYFTGNAIFNRSMRLYARKKGYSLNQRGLSKGVIRDRTGTKTTEGEIIASRTEQEIFDVLGLRWRPPEHRRP